MRITARLLALLFAACLGAIAHVPVALAQDAVTRALLKEEAKQASADTKAEAPVEQPRDEVPTPTDAVLARAVAKRLHNIPDYGDVTVTATGRVVRLEGVVTSQADRAHAEQVASQQRGVVAVENDIQLSNRLTDRVQEALRQVLAKLIGLVAKIPLLFVGLVVVTAAWWAGRGLGRRVHLSRFTKNPYIDAMAGRIIRWIVLLIGILLALDLLEATTVVGALLGSAGIVGIAIGFAFRDIAENYVSGILLSLRRPFAPGDQIVVDKYEGKVVALTSRSTLLMTLDGNQLSLPNALVFKSVVLNYTQNPNRRFDFVVPIDPGESVHQSQTVGLEAICGVEGVLRDPKPSAVADGYAGGGINIHFYGWVNQRESDFGKTKSEAIRAVKAAFGRAGIEGPRATQYVYTAPMHAAAPAPHPAERPRREPTATSDTSVNHDIDQQLQVERDAHAKDSLI